VTILLLSPLAKSQDLDLKSYSHSERDEIALQLEDREICHRDLSGTRAALNECSNQGSGSMEVVHVVEGTVIGLVLGFAAASIIK
jgi:hypothetical protein